MTADGPGCPPRRTPQPSRSRDGFLNLLKPPGMTSHDVVAFVRELLAIRRAGHLGTLDPAAAGVLPIAVGRATRLFAFAAGPDKAYRAETTFGLTTDTLDAEGAVTSVADASSLTRDVLLGLLPRFTGEIEQRPPAFSAARSGGRKLYELARRGAAVAGSPRRVIISRLELVDFQSGPRPRALVDVVCSAGTYLRALAADLGRAALQGPSGAGCGAYLSFLVRTRVGRFALAEALTLEECREAAGRDALSEAILPLDWPLSHLPAVTVEAGAAVRFAQGTSVLATPPAVAMARAYGPGNRFLGLGSVSAQGQLRPQVVLAGPESAAR